MTTSNMMNRVMKYIIDISGNTQRLTKYSHNETAIVSNL